MVWYSSSMPNVKDGRMRIPVWETLHLVDCGRQKLIFESKSCSSYGFTNKREKFHSIVIGRVKEPDFDYQFPPLRLLVFLGKFPTLHEIKIPVKLVL